VAEVSGSRDGIMSDRWIANLPVRRNAASDASDLWIKANQRIISIRTFCQLLGLGFGLGSEASLRVIRRSDAVFPHIHPKFTVNSAKFIVKSVRETIVKIGEHLMQL